MGVAVSRFFFDFFDAIGVEEITGDEGTDLRDRDQARLQAVSLTGAYLKDHPEMVGDSFPFGVMVRDDRDRSVCEITVTRGR